MTTMAIGKAINAGLRRAMENDPKVLIMGEDVGKLGGVFRVTDGLQKDFGEDRVIDTPLAESGIIGTAVGLALRGYRPVCEIQFDGFVFPGYDQIVSQVAKMHFRSGGRLRVPMVIRIPFGGGIGAVEHHSGVPEAYFAHTAGLKVVAVSNPVDAYWMIQQAIALDDPVVFFEPKRRYWEKADVDDEASPGPAHWWRRGSCGPAPTRRSSRTDRWCGPALDAAAAAAEEGGRSRSSTCGRCRRSICLWCSTRSAVPAAASSCTRPSGRWARRRGRGARHRGVLLLAGGAGAARDRVRHALPAVAGRGGVPSRPRPRARRRRPRPGVLR